MNPDKFAGSPGGRVVQVGHGDAAYSAFVPNPLPPPLAFDTALVRLLSDADRALGELAGLGRALPNPHLLINPFIRREAVLSSRIEGTQADLQFEALHPFIDGNGRIGRLLISLLSVHWNLLPLPLLYLSAFFEKHRSDYYDLLMAVSVRGAWQEWLAFFSRGVAEQARDAVARARQLQDLQSDWRNRLTKARASALLLRLTDALFESPHPDYPAGTTYFKDHLPQRTEEYPETRWRRHSRAVGQYSIRQDLRRAGGFENSGREQKRKVKLHFSVIKCNSERENCT